MAFNDKKQKKVQDKMAKLNAKQAEFAEQEKLNQIQKAITGEDVPQKQPEIHLPVYDIPIYNSQITQADDKNVSADKVEVKINKAEASEAKTTVVSRGGVMMHDADADLSSKISFESERDYLAPVPAADSSNAKNAKDTKNTGKKTKSKKKSKKVPHTSQESIPYEYVYKNGMIEVEEGIFSKSYRLEDVNFKIATDEEQENIFTEFGKLLNMLDSEARAEVTIFNRNVNREEFKKQISMPLKSDKLDKYRIENNAILESKLDEGNNNVRHEKYLTISIPSDSVDGAVKRFQTLDAEIGAHIKRINSVETFPMTIEERLEVLHEIYNGNDDVPFSARAKVNGTTVKAFDMDMLRKMGISSKDVIAPPSMEFSSDYFMLGERYGRTLFIDNLPTFLNTDILPELTDVACNMLTSVHYEPIRQDKSMSLVRNQIVNIDSNVIDAQKKASKSGYSPDLISHELKKAQEEAGRILEDITSRNQKLFLLTIVVTVFGDSLDELNKFSNEVKSVASKFLCSLKPLPYQQEYAFATSLPLANNKIYTQKLLTTEAASVFIPFSMQEVTQDGGFYYGLNAISRNIVLFNRKKSLNANGIILGTPGSGKSFSAKREIINAILGTDDEVYVIDPEREYAPLAALFGGEVIRIAAGSKTYINPFDMDINYADDDDPVTLKSDYIGSICETVIGGKYGLMPIQKTVIDRCVRQLYQPYLAKLAREKSGTTCDKTIMPTMNDFYQLLLSQPEDEAQQIALALELYCLGSLDTFAHRTNVNSDARFVVYDIKDIGTGMKELGLQVCLNDIWNKIIENHSKGKRTWFYMDEFYLLTQHDSSAKFLQQVYKRARKWGGIPTGITQDVEDLLSSREARVILNNCDFVMMLKQSPLSRAELSEMYGISPSQQVHITNSDKGQGLLYTGKTIIPLIDKFPSNNSLYKAMTTSPDEVNLEEITIKSDE